MMIDQADTAPKKIFNHTSTW